MVLNRVWVTGKGALKWEFGGEFTTRPTTTTEAFNNVAITRTGHEIDVAPGDVCVSMVPSSLADDTRWL